MKTIECKRVDVWDGGDRHNFGFRINKDVPDEVIKAADKYCMITNETIIIFDSLEEKDDNSPSQIRKRIWNKLTPQERKLMGMEKP